MSHRASGTFEIKIEPLPAEAPSDRPTFPRLVSTKQFRGDLEGTSQGEMMSVDGVVEGSRAYVAIERVQGSLGGRKGNFALIHNGTMRRGGDFAIAIKVVPDSGTSQLTGLTGTMQIVIEGGKHFYTFDYSLPEEP